MASSLINRRIKRYRASNPYSHRFFFGCISALIGTLKIVVLLLVLAACWKGFLVLTQAENSDVTVAGNLDRDTDAGAVVQLRSPITAAPELAPSAVAAQPAVTAPPAVAAPPAVTPSESNVATLLSSSPVTETVLFDEAWVMSLDRDTFTVQLGTSPDLDKLVAFAREVFASEQAHVLPFRVSSIGNPIYGLVFGEHADLQAARDAVAQFPAAYRQYDPWIRPAGLLQDQVQAAKNKLGL